jgi:hypothetical protein
LFVWFLAILICNNGSNRFGDIRVRKDSSIVVRSKAQVVARIVGVVEA